MLALKAIPENGILEEVYPDSSFLSLPVLGDISAGFPSPASDYLEHCLTLSDYFKVNHSSTYFVRVKGDSLIEDRIFDGDLLVIDRSLKMGQGRIGIFSINGEFTAKRYKTEGKRAWLIPSNKSLSPIELNQNQEIRFWGIVAYTVHKCLV
jgi:DNA polymerase V